MNNNLIQPMLTLRASSAHRYALCPGSAIAEHGAVETDESIYAKDGTEKHALIEQYVRSVAGASRTIHSMPDSDGGDRVRRIVEAYENIVNSHGGVIHESVQTEFGVFIHVNERLNWTGHPDCFVRCNDATNHLFDWKTGYANYPAADVNAQLRVYAIGVSRALMLSTVTVHLITANHGVTSCEYRKDDLAAAKKEIEAIALACSLPSARRIPGAEQCKYCKSCGTQRCPESLSLPAKMADYEAQVGLMQPAQLARVLELRIPVERVLKLAVERGKELAAKGELPGYDLRPTGFTRKIEDVDKARESVCEQFSLLDPEEFNKCVDTDVSFSRLLDSIAKKNEESKSKVEFALREALGDNLSEKKRAPMLVRK